ncbi:MAG: TonB-dependent receptor [Brevundimonas sp.]|nr:MAG: TonB-dependent receptor [Brevundimonas sp.]
MHDKPWCSQCRAWRPRNLPRVNYVTGQCHWSPFHLIWLGGQSLVVQCGPMACMWEAGCLATGIDIIGEITMNLGRKTLLATTVIAGLATFAPSFALAQTAPRPGAPQQPAQQPTAQDESTDLDEVIVTGSRIRRSEFTSTQPVQIITSEEATLEGMVDTSEILQGSTAAATAGQINNYFTGFVTTGGPGVNTISLRGLGAQRTLVLINGRRAGPAGSRGTVGAVDLNTIPSSLIERVEILTDGASSIYGSDAVAGVINIITKQNLDGGSVDVYASQPIESGGEEYQASAGYGWTFDKGYLSLGADYYERRPLLFGDRDFFRCPQQVFYEDPAFKRRADVIDPATGDYKCSTITAGLFTLYGGPFGAGTDYAPDAAAVAGGGPTGCDLTGFRQVVAFTTGAGACAVTAARGTEFRRLMNARTPTDTPRYATRTAVSPVTRTSISAFGGYDITPDIEVFGELLLTRRESAQESFRQLFPAIAGLQGAAATQPRNPFGRVYDFTIAAPSNNDQQVDYTRAVWGARGTLNVGRGFDWDLVAQYSKSSADYGSTFLYGDRFLASLGADGCNEAVLKTATACPTGGVDYYSPAAINGDLSQVDRDFLLGYEVGSTEYIHKYIEGSVSGELFDLPAGPVGAAFGFQYRREFINDVPGAQERGANFAGSTAAVITTGSDQVTEIFGELEIPILRDLPFFNRLTVNVSGRQSEYESYGSSSTYKVGFNWALTSWFRIRGSEGTSFRAPALYEQFLGNQSGFLSQATVDPCRSWGLSTNEVLRANCAADGVPADWGLTATSSATVITGGGRDNLTPETAESQSLGVIWTPSFVDLSVALDYFNIEIKDQVAQFGAANIVGGCYRSLEFASEPLCDLFVRNPNGAAIRPNEIVTIQNNYVNISRQQSEGLDLTARYNKEFSFGDLTLSGRASYIINWESQLRTASVPSQINDQIGNPDWVANVSARFDRNDWTVFWTLDYTPEVSNDRFFTTNATTFFGAPIFVDRTEEEYMVQTVSVRKRMDKWTAQVGIRNLFDEIPHATSNSSGGRGAGNVPLSSQYDYLGRRVFLNISRTF